MLILTSFSLLLLVSRSDTQRTPVNVALNKPTTARGTCGTPSEDYYAHTEIDRPSQDRVRSICDSSNTTLAHPPSNTVDEEVSSIGQNYTWWQSASKNKLQTLGLDDPEAVITIDLLEVYKLHQVSIQMGDSVRPGQLSLLKSSDGVVFTPWEHRVSSPADCLEVFDVSPTNTDVESLDSVLCRTYASDQAQPRNEQTLFEFEDVPELFSSWQETRFLRFEFYNMPFSFGFLSDDYHHYTVRNIEALAYCNCNSHATECIPQPSPMDPGLNTYQCVCQGNTDGINCEQCLPSYNQLAYQTGQDGFICQSCFCYDHSDVCTYDADVEAFSISMASLGVYSGGGVCSDCQHNTTGINCESCQALYYRPSGRNQSDMDACQPCECFYPGTKEEPALGISRGECVTSEGFFNMSAGDCFCKDNVGGIKCDECLVGTYNLEESNPEGCTDCACNPDGSTGESCDSVGGQCPCKPTTTNRQCDQCMDAYYNLTSANSEGCSSCECDVGGALSDICDHVSGSCDCRRGVIGRQCNRAAPSRFIPSLHYISAEFEDSGHLETDDAYAGYAHFGYVTLVNSASISVTLTIPSSFSGQYEVLLRSITQGLTLVTLTFTPGSDTPGAPLRGSVSVPVCTSWCYATVTTPDRGELFTLSSGSWEVQVETTLQGGAKILLDQLVAVPVEFLTGAGQLFGANTAGIFESRCDIRTNELGIGGEHEAFCLSSVFSLMTYYLNGTMLCDCDVTGSLGDQCDPWGGSCECKPGVGGQRCDTCLPGYYGFGLSGCIACGCYGDDKVCDVVTGQCVCPPNTVGRQCDRCITFTYGLDSTAGCEMCNCSEAGSINLQCDTQGQCPCKPGVGLRDCSSCLPDYKMFTEQGCEPCDCNRAGSVHQECNDITGQCDCKDRVAGLICDECAAESFYLSRENQDGCLQCVCMGITGQCESTTHRYAQFDLDLGQIPDDIPTSSALGWRIPESFLSGDLLSLYGGELIIMLVYEEMTTLNASFDIVLMSDYGQAVFTGSLTEPFVETTITIPIREEHWSASSPVSRPEFIKMLAAVNGFIVLATSHNCSVTGLSYIGAVSPDSLYYDASALQAYPVEDCSCGEGYDGLSCQYCSEGFFRQNGSSHPFLGTCQRCECNGHSQSCDLETGQCIGCEHYTQGSNCEVCVDGYYGDAMNGTPDDCVQCPCNNQRTSSTSCDVVNGTIHCLSCADGHMGPLCDQCEDFYYGSPGEPDGFCAPCDCNGNTLQCDPVTGVCIGCQHQTGGFNCQHCQDFYYGDATQQDCQDCNCSSDGSVSLLCNAVSGQCPCLSNVTERQCQQCLPNHYNYGSSNGCTPCECNQFGSLDLQCSEDGACQCFADVLGAKCDRCDGSFGLPLAECQSCGCDPLGTVGGDSAICDHRTGQCPCVAGISGRTCDQCDIGYINYQNGTGTCTSCDLCVTTLIDSVQDLSIQSLNLSIQFDTLEQYWAGDVILLSLIPLVNGSSADMGVLLSQLTLIRAELESINVSNLTQDTDQIENMVSTLLVTVDSDLAGSHAEVLRISALHELASSANQVVVDLQQSATRRASMVSSWNESSHRMTVNAESITEGIQQTSFDAFERVINRELVRSLEELQTAVEYKNQKDDQVAEVGSLSEFLESTYMMIEEIRANITIVQGYLELAEHNISGIAAVDNQTLNLIKTTEGILDETADRLDTMASLAARAISTTSDADQAHREIELILRGPQDGFQASWSEVRSTVEDLIESVAVMRDELLPLVEAAEDHVRSLELDVVTSENILSSALTGSHLAAQAVQFYQEVVSVVADAQYLASNASEVVQSTDDYLATRDLTSLEQEAALLKTQSSELLDEIDSLDIDAAGMLADFAIANTSLVDAEGLRESVKIGTAQLNSSVNSLEQHIADTVVNEAIISTESEISITQEYSVDLSENITSLNSSIQDSRASIQSLDADITAGNSLLESFADKVTSLEDTEAEVSQKFSALDQVSNRTIQLRSMIEAKMATIRAKLAHAQNRLVNSRLPARFEGSNNTLQLASESPDRQTLFDEIGLRFQTDQRDGLLFFTENPEGQSFLSLEIIASRVVFRFRINDDIVRVQSPVDVCCGEWFQVLASRYANQGHLTITKLFTGGSSTEFSRSPNIFMMFLQLQANTTLNIGGVLSTNQIDLALSRDFTGCISDVSFERKEYDLWKHSGMEGSVTCCEGPVSRGPVEAATINGISLNGFGYVQLPSSFLDIHTQSSFSLEFRTSITEAVILSVTRTDLISYIGLFLSDGRVVFDMNTAGNTRYRITSEEQYNGAQWYKVLVSYNSSSYSMELTYGNGTVREAFQQRTLFPLSFPNLRHSAQLYLGSTETVGGPTSLGFAGCMRDLDLGTDGPIIITEDILIKHAGVSFNTCLSEVTEGFGFQGDFAYAEMDLPNMLTSTKTLQFSFKTTDPHGILAYAFTSTKLFYVTLYHGNVFVQYNNGQGLSKPLQTKGLWLNNGQWQLVSIQFNALSASLKVNSDATIYSSRQLGSDGISIDESLYLGGVPQTFPMLVGGDFPVRESLAGEMKQFSINDHSPNLNDPSIVIRWDGLQLGGVSPAVPALPDLPYPTSPTGQQTITPQPCRAPIEVVPYPGVYRLGATGDGYMAFTLDMEQAGYFLISFVATIEFRAHSSDGVLYYAASDGESPSEWFALLMRDGRLSFNMMTSSEGITGLDVTTKEKYDTGRWYTVLVLRINDLIALLVDETDEYVTNGENSAGVSSLLRVQTMLYLGGLGPDISNDFIQSMMQGRPSFDGCIRMLTVSGNYARDLILPLSSPSESKNVELCEQNNVTLDTHFEGEGFLQLYEDFTIDRTFEMKMDFTTTQREALLFVAVQNKNSLLVLELYDGGLRAIINQGSPNPTVVRAAGIEEYDLCDGRQHTVSLRLTEMNIEISVDDGLVERGSVLETDATIQGPMFIGGISDDRVLDLTEGIGTDSFQGCISSLSLNGEFQDMRNFVGKAAVKTGCPVRIP